MSDNLNRRDVILAAGVLATALATATSAQEEFDPFGRDSGPSPESPAPQQRPNPPYGPPHENKEEESLKIVLLLTDGQKLELNAVRVYVTFDNDCQIIIAPGGIVPISPDRKHPGLPEHPGGRQRQPNQEKFGE